MACQNGGTCKMLTDGFHCQCRELFKGRYCTAKRDKGSRMTKLISTRQKTERMVLIVCSEKMSCYFYYSTEPLYNIADAHLPSFPCFSTGLDTGQYRTVWRERRRLGVALAAPRTLIFYLRWILQNNDRLVVYPLVLLRLRVVHRRI